MTAFERIRDVWTPEWLRFFEKKSADYNTKATNKRPAFQPHEVLGVKGQWADIWRKVWKLHKALWDDEPLEGEQPREIILDLISHLFLTLDLMDKVQQTGGPLHTHSPAVIDAAQMAVRGEPKPLEAMGFIILDRVRVDACPLDESHNEIHGFDFDCSYSISRRRQP